MDGPFLRAESYNQYPIPMIAHKRKSVKISFPYSPGILAPHAAPSFSMNSILNHEKTSIDSFPKQNWS